MCAVTNSFRFLGAGLLFSILGAFPSWAFPLDLIHCRALFRSSGQSVRVATFSELSMGDYVRVQTVGGGAFEGFIQMLDAAEMKFKLKVSEKVMHWSVLEPIFILRKSVPCGFSEIVPGDIVTVALGGAVGKTYVGESVRSVKSRPDRLILEGGSRVLVAEIASLTVSREFKKRVPAHLGPECVGKSYLFVRYRDPDIELPPIYVGKVARSSTLGEDLFLDDGTVLVRRRVKLLYEILMR